ATGTESEPSPGSGHWADLVSLHAGGETSAFSWPLGSTQADNVSSPANSSDAGTPLPWALPISPWILVELFDATRCVTCTGLLPEFERVALALPGCDLALPERNCTPGHPEGSCGPAPFLCA
ncbi:unnamed protein product, partial [Polarella glacialis]